MFQLIVLQLCLASLPRKRGGTDIQIGLQKAQGEGEKPTGKRGVHLKNGKSFVTRWKTLEAWGVFTEK